MAVCKVFVKAGPVNETSKEHGIGHKLEHNLYKGTEKRSEEELNLAADRIGAGQVAHTEMEYTGYSMEVVRKKAPKSMELLAEVLSRPSFPRGKIKLENGVLVTEMADYKDDDFDRVLGLFQSLVYAGTPMSKSILGTERSIKSQNRRDLKRYKDKWYRGENILVVLAGKVSRMGQYVEEFFGKLPPGPVEKLDGNVGYGEPGTKVLTDSTNVVHFILGVPGVSMGDERFFTLQILETILGGHSVFEEEYTIPSSKLYDIIRRRHGISYDISAVSDSGSEVGYFGVKGTVRPHLFNDTLGLVKKEMFGLVSSVTREDLARAKAFLLNFYYPKKVEETMKVAQLMGVPALLLGIIQQPAEIVKKIQAVKLSDIRKAANEILVPELAYLAVLGPKDLKGIKDTSK